MDVSRLREKAEGNAWAQTGRKASFWLDKVFPGRTEGV